jgi:phosphatidylinositol-3-phosphatase
MAQRRRMMLWSHLPFPGLRDRIKSVLPRLLARCAVVFVTGLAGAVCTLAGAGASIPTLDHIVVVVMENHSFSQVIGNPEAPFTNQLARGGALFTQSLAVAHPSEPNYLALFSGSTQGVKDDGRYLFDAPTLAGQLRAAGKRFIGYAETGSPRKHAPWKSFEESQDVERPFSEFPSDFTKLPAVSFVVPNMAHDMHDGSVEQGDGWLRRHLAPYAEWCASHDSLLILTFDEGGSGLPNQIPTVFFGRSVQPGRYSGAIDHYTVLRTIEAIEDLPPLGESARKAPISTVWKQGT